MKPKSFFRLALASMFAVLWCCPVSAQTSPQLKIDSIETLPGEQVRIIFSDTGTGAPGYELEFSPVVGPDADWTTGSQTQITPLDATSNVATLPFAGNMGFFRIYATGGNGGAVAVASFGSDTITVNESEGSVSIQILFSQPYQGSLSYTVGGQATSEDIGPLSGEIQVNGTLATIVVDLVDNMDLNKLRYLTLDLGVGPGYVIGNTNQVNLIIHDDDTLWSGNFQENGNTVGFSLKLLNGTGGLSGFLISDGDGIFPEGEFAAQVDLTDTAFSLSVNSVVLSAGATMFNTEVLLSLVLTANESIEGQTVDASEIEGEATLSIEFPAQPHLNTTLSGPFFMVQQVIRPLGQQIELSRNLAGPEPN